jgi:hypothetical protein
MAPTETPKPTAVPEPTDVPKPTEIPVPGIPADGSHYTFTGETFCGARGYDFYRGGRWIRFAAEVENIGSELRPGAEVDVEVSQNGETFHNVYLAKPHSGIVKARPGTSRWIKAFWRAKKGKGEITFTATLNNVDGDAKTPLSSVSCTVSPGKGKSHDDDRNHHDKK